MLFNRLGKQVTNPFLNWFQTMQHELVRHKPITHHRQSQLSWASEKQSVGVSNQGILLHTRSAKGHAQVVCMSLYWQHLQTFFMLGLGLG